MRLKLTTEGAEFRGSHGMNLEVPCTCTSGLLPRFSVPFRAFRDQLIKAREEQG